jgi:hypothetical protein
MSEDFDFDQTADGTDRRRGKISKKAMRRLDDDVIDKLLLQSERKREPGFWRILFRWLAKKRDRLDPGNV